jgi:hypothetical protein
MHWAMSISLVTSSLKVEKIYRKRKGGKDGRGNSSGKEMFLI